MTDIYQTIESALDNRLESIPDIPTIAYENVGFDRGSVETFVEPVFSPTIREPATRGTSFQTYYQGLYRLEVNTQLNIGKGLANKIASDIITSFEANTDISYGGEVISIRYAEKEAGYRNDNFWTLPVNIGWYIYS